MLEKKVHAIVLIQTWGDSNHFLEDIKRDSYIVSLFHIMGRYSYLLVTNFDNKNQLAHWIDKIKKYSANNIIPNVLSIRTQRIIDVYKQKKDFTLKNYLDMNEKYHFFVEIDDPHHDNGLLSLLENSTIVHSILHIQGEYSFTIEIITEDYNKYKNLLKKIKSLESSIHHIETFEIISVLKYRDYILSNSKDILLTPPKDIRELYTL